jgi:predicted metal-dependent HD superfamily phosphohydrolase
MIYPINPIEDRFWAEGVLLRREWIKMLKELNPRLLTDKNLPDEKFKDLFFEYSSIDRYYHNLKHILECLREFRIVEQKSNYPQEVRLALFYHDLVYDTHAKDNEEKSASILIEDMKNFIPARSLENSVKLVMATKHDKIPETNDEKLAVSIDLAILGKPWPRYLNYSQGIRKEYSWVSEEDFRNGRAKVLESFLAKEKIYPHEFFKEKYEAMARVNLQKEIKMLRS